MKHITSLEFKHLALIAVFVGALGTHLLSAESWAEVTTPSSVGSLLVQLGTFFGAMQTSKPGESE